MLCSLSDADRGICKECQLVAEGRVSTVKCNNIVTGIHNSDAWISQLLHSRLSILGNTEEYKKAKPRTVD